MSRGSRRRRRPERASAPKRSIRGQLDAYTEGSSILATLHRRRPSKTGMLNSKCIGVLKIYESRIAKEEGELPDQGLSRPLRHVRTMIPKTIEFFQTDRREKGFRWLGFIQGVLWTEGLYTIKEMKDHNRPDGAETKQE